MGTSKCNSAATATCHALGLEPTIRNCLGHLTRSIKSLEILKHCGCKKECKGRCLCRKLELPCTELCKCNGNRTES